MPWFIAALALQRHNQWSVSAGRTGGIGRGKDSLQRASSALRRKVVAMVQSTDAGRGLNRSLDSRLDVVEGVVAFTFPGVAAINRCIGPL